MRLVSSASTALRSRAWVEVDLDALRKNLRRVSEGASSIPMVKADAYGLGMLEVVDAICRATEPSGPWAFGVAAVSEGEQLRAGGWQGRIVVFSPAPPGEFDRAAAAGLVLVFSDLDGVARWAATARRARSPLPFHLEIDTGMGRAGFPWAEAASWGPEVARLAAGTLRWEACFTHFHSADEPDLGPTDTQWERFQEALAALPSEQPGEPNRVIHVANSSASLRRAGYRHGLVRPGIALYGGAAGPGDAPFPVVSVRARVGLVREVPAGTTVGYGATYAAERREIWATLCIGYGDGVPRVLSPAGGRALIRGRAVPMIGRISMDVVVVDVTDVTDVTEGDVATLIGRDGDEQIAVDEVAERCGTISYEILTGLTSRLPRLYLNVDATAAG